MSDRVYACAKHYTSDAWVEQAFKDLEAHLNQKETSLWKAYHMRLTEVLRRSLSVKNFLAVGYNDDEDCVVVIEFDKQSDGSFYETKWDEEKGNYYIELP